MTTSLSRGMVTLTFLRLCSRAPRTTMFSRGMGVVSLKWLGMIDCSGFGLGA